MSDWQHLFAAFDRVGSRVTCDPAPADTDEDWLALSRADLARADRDEALADLGFECGSAEDFYTGDDRGRFRSWRRGDLNLIVTPDPEFYNRFMRATRLAKQFNLLRKGDRIALFQAVLYAADYHHEPAPPILPAYDDGILF